MSAQSTIVLLRTPRAPDPYRDVFESGSFVVSVVPVLEFRFVQRSRLQQLLDEPEAFAGLIATSPRAVEALRRVERVPDEWKEGVFFAAGPETARRARSLGLRPVGEEAGTARDLAETIVGRSYEKPLLFLSGSRRREELPRALQEADTAYEELIVYETHVRKTLDWPLEGAADWVAFFSPSGIEAAERSGTVPWERMRTAAIGPTTAAALEKRGWPVDAVADAPRPEGLYQAVRRADRQMQ